MIGEINRCRQQWYGSSHGWLDWSEMPATCALSLVILVRMRLNEDFAPSVICIKTDSFLGPSLWCPESFRQASYESQTEARLRRLQNHTSNSSVESVYSVPLCVNIERYQLLGLTSPRSISQQCRASNEYCTQTFCLFCSNKTFRRGRT